VQLERDFREFVASFNEHDVIGRDDLLRNKIAADRPQDRADVHRMNRQPRQD